MPDLSPWTPLRYWLLLVLELLSGFGCGISGVFTAEFILITQQPQLSRIGCDLALHWWSFKHIGPVELPGDGWSRWNLATFLVRWGASQIEWGTFTKWQQEFKVSMCVSNYFKRHEWEVIKRGRGDLVWLNFTFIVFFSNWCLSWGWIKICLGHLETFGASSKDLLPEAFVYRKLMPDIFCHQEPQIQISLKSAKFLPGGAFFHNLFMSKFWDLFLDWSGDLLVLSSFGLWRPGRLVPCYSCRLATNQHQWTSKSRQQHSTATAINSYQPHSKCT